MSKNDVEGLLVGIIVLLSAILGIVFLSFIFPAIGDFYEYVENQERFETKTCQDLGFDEYKAEYFPYYCINLKGDSIIEKIELNKCSKYHKPEYKIISAEANTTIIQTEPVIIGEPLFRTREPKITRPIKITDDQGNILNATVTIHKYLKQ